MEREQVLALAPDASSVSAAKKLESPAKWQQLGRSERALWGLCKGSGSKPYQTRVDLKGYASKCSCPSRKFPCKHALALMLLSVEQSASFSDGEAPAWVQEWLDTRDDRENKAEEKKAEKKPVDPEAQQKRAQKREEKIQAGLQELTTWLEDTLRVGVAELPNKSYRYWDELAARMVDAQAPGLAAWLRRIGGMCAASEPLAKVVAELAKLHLFVQAYQRKNDLPELAADLKSLVGFNVPEAEVLQETPVTDRWWVVARRQSEEDNLIMRSTWLFGLENQRFAKIIQYAHVSQLASLGNDWMEGRVIEGAVHYFPSATPLRCCVGEHRLADAAIDVLPTSAAPFDDFAHMRERNPWLARFPVLIDNIVPVLQQERLQFYHAQERNKMLRVHSRNTDVWRLLAVSGGEAVSVFGEWDGESLTPLSVYTPGQLISLEARVVRG